MGLPMANAMRKTFMREENYVLCRWRWIGVSISKQLDVTILWSQLLKRFLGKTFGFQPVSSKLWAGYILKIKENEIKKEE